MASEKQYHVYGQTKNKVQRRNVTSVSQGQYHHQSPIYIFELTIFKDSYSNTMKNLCVFKQHLPTMLSCPFANNSTAI